MSCNIPIERYFNSGIFRVPKIVIIEVPNTIVGAFMMRIYSLKSFLESIALRYQSYYPYVPEVMIYFRYTEKTPYSGARSGSPGTESDWPSGSKQRLFCCNH